MNLKAIIAISGALFLSIVGILGFQKYHPTKKPQQKKETPKKQKKEEDLLKPNRKLSNPKPDLAKLEVNNISLSIISPIYFLTTKLKKLRTLCSN